MEGNALHSSDNHDFFRASAIPVHLGEVRVGVARHKYLEPLLRIRYSTFNDELERHVSPKLNLGTNLLGSELHFCASIIKKLAQHNPPASVLLNAKSQSEVAQQAKQLVEELLFIMSEWGYILKTCAQPQLGPRSSSLRLTKKSTDPACEHYRVTVQS